MSQTDTTTEWICENCGTEEKHSQADLIASAAYGASFVSAACCLTAAAVAVQAAATGDVTSAATGAAAAAGSLWCYHTNTQRSWDEYHQVYNCPKCTPKRRMKRKTA